MESRWIIDGVVAFIIKIEAERNQVEKTMSKVREIFPTGDDFVHHATEENGYGYFLFSRDYWEKWRELGNEILQKPEFTIAKVDTNL